jgi:hypothetical protein
MALLWAMIATDDAAGIHQALKRTLEASELDWPACARMGIRHGLATVAAHHLRPFSGNPNLPDQAAACFARMYRANGRRNRTLFHECGRLLLGFRQAGIRCLVLKGIGLALTVYSDHALRHCADIDLLVHPADIGRAGAVAQSLGFAPAHTETDACMLHRTYVTCSEEDILTGTLPLEYETAAIRARAEPHRYRVVVEIHQGLFRDAAGMIRHVDAAPLWYAPRRICLPDGTPILLPSHEVMLIHLAAHAADHGFARLIYFFDIAATIRYGGPHIDWDVILDLATHYEVGHYVYRCLEFVSRECGVVVPAGVLAALKLEVGGRARPLQRSDILAAEREISTGIVLQRLLLEPDRRRFGAALGNILFPPPVIMRRLYGVRNPLLVALCYLLRPILLIARLVRLLLRIARRG